MTEMITITFGDATTLDLKVVPKSTTIDWDFPNLTVTRQPNKVGLTDDPNQGFRTIKTTAYMTATEIVDTLDGKLLPAAAPTYDGTDPKVKIYLSGAKSITMLCIIKKASASHSHDNIWHTTFIFEGRTL